MTRIRDLDKPWWRLATRKGWRKSVRAMLAAVQSGARGGLGKPRVEDVGSERLEVGQRFGAVRKEAGRPTLGAGVAANEQQGQTPATDAGGR